MAELTASGIAVDPARIPVLRRHVAAAVIGNGLEVYDFTVYGYFAVQIGHAFFPSKTPFISLILSLITFGAGFLLRPVGAVVIGRYADRVGRKPAMLFTIGLMGLSILGLALTPSYAVIGVAAPILALTWRLAQGFALGGEIGPTTAFLVEAAPPERRALYGAFQLVSQAAAALIAGLIGMTLATLTGPQALDIWGWRVAMVLGAVVLPFGLWLRRTLPETLHRREVAEASRPVDSSVRGHLAIIFIGLGLITSATIGTYVISYMTTYAISTLHMPAHVALGAAVVTGTAGIVFVLIGAVLSDRFGRRPLMIWPRLASLMVILPAFRFMIARHDAIGLFGAVGVISAIGALTGAAIITAMAESMNKNFRGLGVGVVYATAVAVFGGTTQPIVAALIHFTGDPMAPAWYMMGAGVIGLASSLAIRESAPIAIGKARPAR
jgi:predicted MFS family arabinose efflux permease